MLSGRLRRRALALLGALLLVILIWPPCCATMPKPLPAVLPNVPQIDIPPDPLPAVSVTSPIQQQQHANASKSRKVSELNRFMNVLTVGNYDDRRTGDPGESENHHRSSTHAGSRVSSASATDDRNRTTLNLRQPENNTASYSIEQSIDKNKSNVQVTTDIVALRLLDNDDAPNGSPSGGESALPDARYRSEPQQITHNPTIYSILSQRAPTLASPASSAVRTTTEPAPQVRSVDDQLVRSRNEVNDRGGGGGVVRNNVNQSVFNPKSSVDRRFISENAEDRSQWWPVLSRVGRSASPPHHHRHQHYLTGNGTLMATAAGGVGGRGRGAGRHHHHQPQPHPQQQQQQQQQHRNGTAGGGSSSSSSSSDSSNLERNERSANLSHITGANRKIQLYIKNRYLQLLADGTVNGTHDDQSDFSK